MSELKKELDRNRQAEVREKAKEMGLVNLNLWVKEEDVKTVLAFSIHKDTFIEKKTTGRKSKKEVNIISTSGT